MGRTTEHEEAVAALKPRLATSEAEPVEFRTLTCAALGCAAAGAIVSTEIAVVDYWVPLSLGIVGLVFAIGAFGAAGEEAQSVVLPCLAVLIAAFAILQGMQGMNDYRRLNDDLDRAQQDLQEQLDSIPSFSP